MEGWLLNFAVKRGIMAGQKDLMLKVMGQEDSGEKLLLVLVLSLVVNGELYLEDLDIDGEDDDLGPVAGASREGADHL